MAAFCGYFLLKSDSSNCTVQRCVYVLFSSFLVGFAAFRPIGITRDDLNYLEIFSSICSSTSCNQWIQGARDWGWFSSVGLLKSILPSPRTMLLLGAGGLVIKLWVIYRVSSQSMLALLLYFGVFYQILDLTQLRIAFASSFFILSFYLLTRVSFFAGSASAFVSGIFHKQAFVSLLILLGAFFSIRYSFLVALTLTPMVMMLSGLYPDIPTVALRLADLGIFHSALVKDLDMYLVFKADGVYAGWRIAPIVCYPIVALSLFLAKDSLATFGQIYRYAAVSIISSVWFLWGFASLPDVQVRFFDFMILPVVLLAGVCRFDWWRFTGVVAVSGVFVVKYNILHPLLTGAFVL